MGAGQGKNKPAPWETQPREVVHHRSMRSMKITMLGRRRSGKTWLYRRLIDGLNPSELLGEGESQEEVSGAPSQKAPYVPDFKVRLGSRVVHEEGKHPRKVQLWDTPGDAPDDVPTAVFAATDVFVITADATSKNMLASVPRWVDAIGDVRVVRGRPIPVVLLVTKMDAVSPSPEAILEVRQEALSLGAVLGLTVKFCSALDGFGLDETFADIVRMVPVAALMLTPPNSPRGGARIATLASPRTASNKGVDSFLGYMQAETEALTGKVGDTVPAATKNRTPLEDDVLSADLQTRMAAVEVDGGSGGPSPARSPPSETVDSPTSIAVPPAESTRAGGDAAAAGALESKQAGHDSEDLLGLHSAQEASAADSPGDGVGPNSAQGAEHEGEGTSDAGSDDGPQVRQQAGGGDDEEAVTPLHEEGLRAHEGGGRPASTGSTRAGSVSRDISGDDGVLHSDASAASLPGMVEGGAGGVGAAQHE